VARTTVRRSARTMLLIMSTLVVMGLFGAVVRQSWVTNSTTAGVLSLEECGAEMLHPMTSLLAKLVETQSAAVRGEKVDAGGLREALANVAAADVEHDTELQTRQRLTDLMAQVESVLGRGETGRAAYDVYSGLVTLTLDLYRRIGDSSHLIRDPGLDSFYLMDSAIVRLPDAMVFAGRASDLVTLAGGRPLIGEDAIRAAVARFGVSAAAEQVSTGLTASVDNTARAELGANIAERLDAFKAAADAFAPPTMLAELSAAIDPSSLAANARRVSSAANPLAHLLLHELQAILDERAATLATQRRFTAVSAGLVGVLGFVMLWLLAISRPRRPRDESNGGDVRRGDDVAVGSLTYARALLDGKELNGMPLNDKALNDRELNDRELDDKNLVRAGRVVRSRHRG
jgi:hypothetical protein